MSIFDGPGDELPWPPPPDTPVVFSIEPDGSLNVGSRVVVYTLAEIDQAADPIKLGPRLKVSTEYPFTLPVLDHEHEWVDTTVLEDDERVEICAAGGCSATRTVPL